jgi:hypothetical protein
LSVLSLALSNLVDGAGYATREPQFPSCQGFEVSSNDTRPLEFQDRIISTGVVCNVDGSNFSTPCDVLSGGWATLQSVFLEADGSLIRGNVPENNTLSSTLGWTLWNATGNPNAIYSTQFIAIENQTITSKNGTSGNGESRLQRIQISCTLQKCTVANLFSSSSCFHPYVSLCDRSYPRLPLQLFASQRD